MKHSIKKIFNNLATFMIFSSLLSFFALALIVEQTFAFNKIDNLKGQKEIIASLKNLPKKDLNLAIIQFNGKSTQLSHEIEKLRKLYEYDFTSNYIFDTNQNYLTKLTALQDLTKQFNNDAMLYYQSEDIDEEESFKTLENSFFAINSFINSLMMDDVTINQEKSNLLQNVLIALFAILFLYTFFYKRRLHNIYNDILHLYSIEHNKPNHATFSEEADAILHRLKRKPVISENPAMIDSLTEINNLKGLYAAFSEKKIGNDTNYISVTVLEVDNFSKTNRPFSQELSQMILKKIAFAISLHEQPNDVIGRTDYNQFAVILSRASKEQTFKDMELIRESIAELKFHTKEKGAITITVSGGLAIKHKNVTLDDALKEAKNILLHAQETGKNKISQKKDLVEHDL